MRLRREGVGKVGASVRVNLQGQDWATWPLLFGRGRPDAAVPFRLIPADHDVKSGRAGWRYVGRGHKNLAGSAMGWLHIGTFRSWLVSRLVSERGHGS